MVTALLAMEARKPHMIVSQNIKWVSSDFLLNHVHYFLNSRLLPLTSATLNPVSNVTNTNYEIDPTGAAEAATTYRGEAVHESFNHGDVVKINANNNIKRKPLNKNTGVVKNLPQNQVKNNNCETSGRL